MYRNSTWQNAKPDHKLKLERETNKPSKSIDLYGCVIKIKHQFFGTWLTMGHVPREKYHGIAVSFMEEGGNITGY